MRAIGALVVAAAGRRPAAAGVLQPVLQLGRSRQACRAGRGHPIAPWRHGGGLRSQAHLGGFWGALGAGSGLGVPCLAGERAGEPGCPLLPRCLGLPAGRACLPSLLSKRPTEATEVRNGRAAAHTTAGTAPLAAPMPTAPCVQISPWPPPAWLLPLRPCCFCTQTHTDHSYKRQAEREVAQQRAGGGGCGAPGAGAAALAGRGAAPPAERRWLPPPPALFTPAAWK